MGRTRAYPISYVTVDVVCFTVRAGSLDVLLVQRGVEPFAGQLALPGGFVHPDETLEQAARRELREETGIEAPARIEQLATYGAPDRDPRARTVSAAYLAIAPSLGDAIAGTDAAAADWYAVDDVLDKPSRLAFDHATILSDAVDRARGKLEYSPLAADFCDAEFTVRELRAVYEAMLGRPLDPANFHRKVTGAKGFLEPTGRTTNRGVRRPAALYRKGPATRVHPPLLLQEG